ncbi:hypothetical protein ACRALDRAFT_1077077 [Sodiomyces alcalophilus JCM 7366]|uniref:uncharacterized protein n=1 Tax=Sodiomyces alcalophilus JCM 7366 TaxID=591952 RepID=UPI0039B5EC40
MSSTDTIQLGESQTTDGRQLVVISVIEDILNQVVDDISHGRQPSIPYRSRPRGTRPSTSRTAVRFPGRSQDESVAFGLLTNHALISPVTNLRVWDSPRP